MAATPPADSSIQSVCKRSWKREVAKGETGRIAEKVIKIFAEESC